MGRRKRNKIDTDVTLTGIADKGKAVGRNEEGMVYFVDGAVPGDKVDVLIRKKKSSYKMGQVAKFHSYSDLRVEPFCAHFSECGGCKWQNLSYASQLKFKNQSVLDVFSRLSNMKAEEVREIIGCAQERYYRNKIEYSFSNRRWVPQKEIDTQEKVNFGPASGFHRSGAFDKIVQVEKCHLQEDLSNQLRNWVHEYVLNKELSFYDAREHKGFIRNMVVRNSSLGQWMVSIIFGEENEEEIFLLLDQLKTQFPQVDALYYVINTKLNDSLSDQTFIHYHGKEKIEEKLGAVNYHIGPKSFFQTNSKQAEVLYNQILELADLSKEEVVYDLYCGLGSIALYVAQNCKTVIGIEQIEAAIEDAENNKKLNGIENAFFEVGDCKDIFSEDFINKYGYADTIIVDPPRAGLHQNVVNMLAQAGPKKIVYVSCNPSTQARDVALLSHKYYISILQPVDMFPHTHHIENILLLKVKDHE